MRIMNAAFLRKVDSWLSSVRPEHRLVLIHDKDPDGVCSAAIISRLFLKLRGRLPDLVTHVPGSSAYGPTPALLRKLRKFKPDRIITLDLGLDSEPKTVKALARIAPTLVLDHHKVYDRLRMRNCLLVKPQFFCTGIEPVRYCTSKLAYDLASRLADMRETGWLAVAGSCADMATKPWRRWIAGVARRNKLAWNYRKPFDSRFGHIADMIQLAIAYKESFAHRALLVAQRASGPREMLADPVLQKAWKAVRTELHEWLRNTPRWAEWHRELKLIYYPVKAKYHIKPTLSTLLGIRYPHWTVITMARYGASLNLSARRADGKLAVNDLLQEAAKGIPGGRGGGHRQAAGGDIPAKYERQFKKRLVELLGKS